MKNFSSKWLLVLVSIFVVSYGCKKTEPVTEVEIDSKVVLITLDGLRWQELFTGADPLLISNPEYVHDTTALSNAFWRDQALQRRNTLMPFMWNEIGVKGQIYGNRVLGNNVNLTNSMWFSYPGYSEILCGYADDKIDSNDKINNKNVTVLEYIHQQPGYQNKVAAFTSWDVFPYIINEDRSGIPVNAGYEILEDAYTPAEILINQLQMQTPKLWETVRLDAFTHQLALSHLENKRSKLLYISYGETDDFAHEGEYDEYLYAAQRTDGFLKQIWEYLQSDPFYKDQTTMMITTDHGRGIEPIDQWKHHGKSSIPHSDEVWLAVMGPEILPKGEIKSIQQLYSNQIAATIAQIMGFEYPEDRAGKSMFQELTQ